MEFLKAQTIPEVWLLGVEHLAGLRPREDFDVFLNVATPTVLTTRDTDVSKLVGEFLKNHNGTPVETVAETIFPIQDYIRGGEKGVFEIYPKRMEKIHNARASIDRGWGCYAMRFIQQKDHNGNEFNPLQCILEKMRNHGQYKASYELNNGGSFAEELPIYDSATDRKRLYGGPCLSHISIKIDNGKVRLNATYRSHYYVQRLLGNLLGLARLQYFLAHEAKLEMGPLTINSTFARLDIGSASGNGSWNVRQIQTLLETCRNIYEQQEAA